MIEEAINRVAALTREADTNPLLIQTLSHPGADGNDASFLYKTSVNQNGVRVLGDVIRPFRAPKLQVTTLAGFVDAVAAGVAGDITGKAIHVEDHLTVSLVSTASDKYGVRDTLIAAKHTPLDAFKFDTPYEDPQKFIIGLQVAFLMTEDTTKLIAMVSKLKAGSSVETADDGYSQTVTVKQGEISTADVKIPPRVKLIPIRSFWEIAHVQSEFLLRFKMGNAGQAMPALHNVDGTKWVGETMLAIKHWLEKQEALKGLPVIA